MCRNSFTKTLSYNLMTTLCMVGIVSSIKKYLWQEIMNKFKLEMPNLRLILIIENTEVF